MRALHDAHPDYVNSVALQDVLGYESNHQLAGLMGAFGRWLANTEGFQENAEFFQWQQDEGTDMLEYRLAETVPEALEQAGLV